MSCTIFINDRVRINDPNDMFHGLYGHVVDKVLNESYDDSDPESEPTALVIDLGDGLLWEKQTDCVDRVKD